MRYLLPLALVLATLAPLRAQGPAAAAAAKEFKSHPPLRLAPPPAERPLAKGPSRFVDATKGDDRNDGGQEKPWRTINHALRRLKPGDTLYLRGGSYYEHVKVDRAGSEQAPITLRSFPGEQAILDGGFREFFESPAQAWEPFDKGRPQEYRSRQPYPNLRDALGAFGDSNIGLHTYHHARDLRAVSELWDFEGGSKTNDIKPVYCGPGLWYDQDTGHIHVRLSHTHVPDIVNYRGATDPRQLPLVVAPFRSVPLQLDGARHIRIQDLVLRGGGHDTVILRQCVDIEFDNVTVWCGTYGMRVHGTHGLKLLNSGLHGSVPPWTFRTDTSLRSRPGTPYRDITRFGTHALLVPEGWREFEVFALPINDNWEIAHCDFTDGHDGLYLGSINVRLHHNRVFDVQDDGIYLSPMYTRIGGGRGDIHLYQNYIATSLTALAFGGPEKVNVDMVHFYRNIVDLRQPLQTGRPSAALPKPRLTPGHVMGDHGGPPWSTMRIYHNTFVMTDARKSDMGLLSGVHAERPRHLFNNILLHLGKMPALNPANPDLGAQADGNLYWSPGLSDKAAASFFAKFRASAAFEKSKKQYAAGVEAGSKVADPKFVKFAAEPTASNVYQLSAGSPAIDAGASLPADWPDPLRAADKGRPDNGALPLGMAPFRVGR